MGNEILKRFRHLWKGGGKSNTSRGSLIHEPAISSHMEGEWYCKQHVGCWRPLYDHAVMESFYKTLKSELLTEKKFPNADVARYAIFEYIKMFYHTRRMHSSLGYLSPSEYEMPYT